MSSQKSGAGRRKFWKLVLLMPVLLSICCLLFSVVSASEKWQGVDESVVERVAKEHGREAMTPLINTGQGDLLLFVFLFAGTVGGFAAGYYWRVLIERKIKGRE
jgi:hypothetical protein